MAYHGLMATFGLPVIIITHKMIHIADWRLNTICLIQAAVPFAARILFMGVRRTGFDHINTKLMSKTCPQTVECNSH